MKQLSNYSTFQIASSILLLVTSLLIIKSFWVWAYSVFPFYGIKLVSASRSIEFTSPYILYALNAYVGLIGIIITVVSTVYLLTVIHKLK